MKFRKIHTVIFISGMLAASCEFPIDVPVTHNTGSYVVDGTITDRPGIYNITITHSSAYTTQSDIGSNYPVLFAEVSIIDQSNAGKTEILTEYGNGTYATSAAYAGIPGHTYVLHIRTVNGNEIMSYPEVMPEISRDVETHYEFVHETIYHPQGHRVWITMRDIPGMENYYQWIYEGVYLFATGVFVPGHADACWMYEYSYFNLNLAADIHFDGQQFDHDITLVPFFSSTPYLVTIYTRSLSKNAYEFWHMVDQQVNHSSGIFGAPHSFIRGNMYCVNDQDLKIYGYFGASSEIKSTVFIRRDEIGKVKDLRLYEKIPCDEYPNTRPYTGNDEDFPDGWDY